MKSHPNTREIFYPILNSCLIPKCIGSQINSKHLPNRYVNSSSLSVFYHDFPCRLWHAELYMLLYVNLVMLLTTVNTSQEREKRPLIPGSKYMMFWKGT